MAVQWEYARIIHPWNGKVLVAFTNPELKTAQWEENDFMPLLHYLGQLGFEMVTQQFFPMEASFTASSKFVGDSAGKANFTMRQMIYLKRRAEH